VGVAKDAKYDSIRRKIPPTVYVPYVQHLTSAGQMHFTVRTVLTPLSIASAVRRIMNEADITVPIYAWKRYRECG
jgi:hypothetical protein